MGVVEPPMGQRGVASATCSGEIIYVKTYSGAAREEACLTPRSQEERFPEVDSERPEKARSVPPTCGGSAIHATMRDAAHWPPRGF